jgi:hypothetical protein
MVARSAKAERQADNEIERKEALMLQNSWSAKLKAAREAALIAEAEIPGTGIGAERAAHQIRADFMDFATQPMTRQEATLAHYVKRCIFSRSPGSNDPIESITVQFIIGANMLPTESNEAAPKGSKGPTLVLISPSSSPCRG